MTTRFCLSILLISAAIYGNAQTFGLQQQSKIQYSLKTRDDDGFYKPKAISYNSIGYLAPLSANELIIGGTSTVYKRFGSFLAYKWGLKNYSLPNGERGDIIQSNVISNGGVFTGRSQHAVTLMISTGISYAIWKKMPIYIGAGFTRYRYFAEYLDPRYAMAPRWTRDDEKTGFQLNYTAGFFLPLFSRVLLNVGYDHNPQSVFIGLGIRAKDAYKDIDEWR